jgi:hypothetical protein
MVFQVRMEWNLDYRISLALAKGYGSFCEINIFPLDRCGLI